MKSDRIAHRITDLLKLSGLQDEQAVEEMTDHYLTHIEEEIKRGVNAQKAVRETYQEVANFDASHFHPDDNSRQKRGLLVFFILFVGLAFYFFFNQDKTDLHQEQFINFDKSTALTPPKGLPLKQSELKVTSNFGLRMNPKNKEKVLHKGIDFKAKLGTPVFSTGDGVVCEAGYSAKSGNYISIKHNDQFVTKYLHLEKFNVAKNEIVKEGDMIGKVGNSGMSILPHLHYEIIKDEVPVDPEIYINP